MIYSYHQSLTIMKLRLNLLLAPHGVICFFFIYCFLLQPTPVIAQYKQPVVNVETLTVEDGLSQGTVYGLAQDRKGFIWIATFNGLDRYDGNEFIHFRHDEKDSFSISSNQVRMILEDSHQRLWISTNDNGLNYFDPVARRFYHFLPGKRIVNLVEDAAGGLYVNLDDTLARLTIKPGTKEGLAVEVAFFNVSNSLRSDIITSCRLYADRHRNVFLTARNGLYSLASRGTKQPFFLTKLYSYEEPTELHAGWHIAPQLLTDNQTGKYYLITSRSLMESSDSLFSHPVKVHDGILSYDATFIDNQRRLWYTAKEATRLFNLRTGEETVFLSAADSQGNYFGSLTPQLQDKSGTIWITTPGHGLITYSDDENVFHSLLNGSYVGALKQVGDKDFVAMNKWLVRLTGLRPQVTTLTEKESKNYDYFGFPQDDKKVCWQAEDGTVIAAYNRDYKKVFQSPVEYHTYDVLQANKLPASYPVNLRDTVEHMVHAEYLFLDRDASLWMYHPVNGLVIYNTKTNTYHLVRGEYPCSLRNDTKMRMYEDVNGTMWASVEMGIMTCHKTTGVVRYYLYEPDSTGCSLADKNVTSFCDDPADPQHIIWVGTRNGLSRMNKQTGICRNFGEKDGLPNNVIYDVVPDGKGNLWLSTNGGLSCLNTVTFHFRNFTVGDGLQGSEFNGGATLTMPDGTLVFGGTNGLTYFNPAEIKPLTPPLTLVTDVRIFGKPVKNTSAGNLPVEDMAYATDVSVSYRDNVITFAFTGTDYRKKNSVQYRYKLIPFDNVWHYAGTAHEATYTNLDPGDYTFIAEASNTNGVWGKESEALHLHVLPLWWQTGWFKGLTAATVFLLFYAFYRYRLRKALEVERVRNRIASDLHDEIGSTLSAITLFSDMAKRQSETATPSPQLLQRINETSHKVTQTMRDIVWSVSTKNDSFDKMITHMHEHAAELLNLKDYELHFTVDEKLNSIHLSMEKRQNIYLVYKEALNNIIKYACGRNVWINIYRDKAHLLLSVKDDGKGFDPAMDSNGNGLANMKKRASAIQGSAVIRSVAGGGCEVVIKVPV